MADKTISARKFPSDLWQLLRVEAAKTGKTMPQLLIEAVQAYLNRKDGRK